MSKRDADAPPAETPEAKKARVDPAADAPADASTEALKEEGLLELERLFKTYGEGIYIGEAISQREHAIQAALAAESEGFPDTAVIAAFLHDIGHMIGMDKQLPSMAEFGTKNHQGIGADWLKKYQFPSEICELVQNHVGAKRYLVATDKEYAAKLSHASTNTLRFQGGPMSEQEAKSFAANPLFRTFIQMRTWDEKAKVVGMELPPLSKYYSMIRAILGLAPVQAA
eukprot:TRINITY_DN1274_c0_g1_i1.p2 TRINITY_DN1274_c0_g1~~TRINITY_DN1274_c0_g1_i1.p2  ORF type:complete len:236 (+),score=66.52 TRINITY_DN1274_c0_g1_i1:30-710(+)